MLIRFGLFIPLLHLTYKSPEQTHLHFLVLINQEKTGDLLQEFCSMRFAVIGYLRGKQAGGGGGWRAGRHGRRLDRDVLGRFRWWGVRHELVFLLVASTVGAFLAVLAQVDLAVGAADRRAMALAAVSIAPFTAVTVGDVSRSDPNPRVVLQALLAVELELTADTLQPFAFVALKRSLLRAPAGVTLLTY